MLVFVCHSKRCRQRKVLLTDAVVRSGNLPFQHRSCRAEVTLSDLTAVAGASQQCLWPIPSSNSNERPAHATHQKDFPIHGIQSCRFSYPQAPLPWASISSCLMLGIAMNGSRKRIRECWCTPTYSTSIQCAVVE